MQLQTIQEPASTSLPPIKGYEAPEVRNMTRGHGAKPYCSLAVKKTQVKILQSKDSNPVLVNSWQHNPAKVTLTPSLKFLISKKEVIVPTV